MTAAMTRQPTGPDAGADDGDPPVAPGPRQRLAQPVDDPADCAGDRRPRRCGSIVHTPPQQRRGPRPGDALPPRPQQGHILNELQEIIERPEETDHVLRFGLHRLAITEFPLLHALAPALASYDGAAELDRGLDLLLSGLTATLTPDESPRSV